LRDLEELKSLNLVTILGKTLGILLRCTIDKYDNHTNFSTLQREVRRCKPSTFLAGGRKHRQARERMNKDLQRERMNKD